MGELEFAFVEVDMDEKLRADFANQDLPEYIRARFRDLPGDATTYLNLADDMESRMHLEILFRSEFWRGRHDLLEVGAQSMAKKIAAMEKVLLSLLGDREVVIERVNEALKVIPEIMEIDPR